MCSIPAGPFMMGCNKAVDTGCFTMEGPYHRVTVSAFKIDKYEVTAEDYKACVTAGGCTPTNTGSAYNYDRLGGENHPINGVDWNQAKAYCAWAGKRLPTEAEWEKAARGTDGRRYPWGNNSLDCDHAVMSTKVCSNTGTAPVGSKSLGASPYGALDMSGNVWEWVEDWYHSTYTGAPSDGSAWVTPTGTSRVLRGGSWGIGPTGFLRVSARYDNDPTLRNCPVGFRCAWSQ
jgi:formylglycine-generating enzyme required for sulfatase activity